MNCNLTAAGIDQEWFDAVVSADLFQRLKPAPDIFLAAAEQLDILPRNCIVIEDASAGIQAARAAGKYFDLFEAYNYRGLGSYRPTVSWLF